MKLLPAFVPARRWARYGCGVLLAALPAFGNAPPLGALPYLEPVRGDRLLVLDGRGQAGVRVAVA